MSDLFPIILSCAVFSFIVGMVVGLFAATEIYSRQNKAVLRLQNIHEIAQDLFDGLYDGAEKDVALFILCESDLRNVNHGLPKEGRKERIKEMMLATKKGR